jgi:hypothetical protein
MTSNSINTKINLVYNGPHKPVNRTLVLAGAITADQIATIADNLIEAGSGAFIAYQVGLPTISENAPENPIFPRPGDHAYTEMVDWMLIQPEPADLHTTDRPNADSMTIDKLTQRIAEVGRYGWKVAKEEERLTLDPFGTAGFKVNTRFEMLYRSSSDKRQEIVILSGAITDEQIKAIEGILIDGFQVIAPQVGLPSPLSNLLEEQGRSAEDNDHALTSMEDWYTGSPAAASLHTFEKPTVDLSVDSFTAQLQEIGPHGWDHMAEGDRLDIPSDDYEDNSPSF